MMNFPERHVVAPLTEKLYQKADMEKIPLNGTFELSPVCNFSCRMCYVRKTQKEVADELGISQSYISRLEKKIINKMKKDIMSKTG